MGHLRHWIATATTTIATGMLVMACAELLGLAPLEEGPGVADASTSNTDTGIDGGDSSSPLDHCSNDEQDVDETDLNCGGSCGKCAKGKKCKTNSDCAKTCEPNGLCGGCAGAELIFPADSGCIDSTEVRVRNYNDFLVFLKSAPKLRFDDPRCRDANAVVPTPDNFQQQMLTPDLPVRRVDWCSAKAYCRWRGEKLCGGFSDAVRLTMTDVDDPTKDQWMAACAGQNRTEYPYLGSYFAIKCNGADQKINAPWDAGGNSDCKTVSIEVYDQSGNVAEWEDACDARNGRDECLVRGGSYLSDAGTLKCGSIDPRSPTNRTDDVGFRCCE